MSSHGVPRGPRTRTDEQKRLDSEKIQKYRELEEQIQSSPTYDATVFQNTTKLLRLNPEYYTVWNVRRRCLTSSLLSKRPPGLPSSGASSSTSPTGTSTLPSAAPSGSSSAAIPSSSPSTQTDLSTPSPDKGVKGEDETHSKRDQDLEAQRKNDTDVLVSELHFTIPLLLEFPKCYWIWSYRLWVLEQAVARLDVARARRIWEEELALDSKMLTKDRRNFHAWGYRRQVIERLESKELSLDGGATTTSLVEPEFAYTTKMIHQDLSNFSAWHNRSKLIPRLLAERNADDAARKAFLEEELGIIREALNVGPEDQSLWFYHQFLMLDLTEYVGRPTIVPDLSLEERMAYIARELDDIRDLLSDYDDVKWIYEALFEYTLAVAKMEERPLAENERRDVEAWLAQLRKLDPKRSGRWDDLDMEHIRGRQPRFAQESN
ncbi:geranylgeranyl transferase type-2 subunit alpha [Sporothrix brasiliensis 5110]|uniref:Geranylgeranyl transferase type-2 subunit alpha n=1 Tax=Sporothrix brasiliensis 5110 TaxID=1398154 RepID=A0A0C2IMX5_9PEZI|nr:geranylgeranyl transferase type-2 subunit alpha [Sporothrix brasiliensis 5110]KIH86337.1 geranylgeranyl transferase type-2 subunit alpha [Sporothrix brasiliensis 5110]